MRSPKRYGCLVFTGERLSRPHATSHNPDLSIIVVIPSLG